MSTDTFLEFNRDLFLCNTIHDPQNLDGVVPVIKDGSLYKRKTVTDPHDNVYLLPYDFLSKIKNTDYTNGYFQDDQLIYDILISPVEVAQEKTDNAKIINAMIKWWESESLGSTVMKINYKTFANKINTYIYPKDKFDIWLGSGRIDLSYNYFTGSGSNPTIQGSSITIGNKKYTFGANVDVNTVIQMITRIRSIQNIEKDLTYLNNFITDSKLSFKTHLEEATKTSNRLNTDLVAFLQNNSNITITDVIPGDQTGYGTGIEKLTGVAQPGIAPPMERYVFTVKRGHLVRYNQGYVGKCDDYNLKTICPRDDPQKWENCEICKNFQYRDWYDQNNPTQINLNARYDDATSEYQHMWLQTWNLGIGIMVLAYGIYYQLS